MLLVVVSAVFVIVMNGSMTNVALPTVYSIRRAFAMGLLGFAAGSLVCAVAPSLPVLVAGRMLQAAGLNSI